MTDRTATGRLFVLELSGGRIHSMATDGTERQTLVEGARTPDGIAVDAAAGHIYWTNMGVPSRNDGLIERADLDGGNRTTIIPEGVTFTPKQIHLDRASGKLYWSDREGMRVMRANLDGSEVETLIETGRGDADRRDATRWCVGITVDPVRGHFYWTQKGGDDAGVGRIFRAGMDMPAGASAIDRPDIETLFDHLPEPIDLELDAARGILYWTDRGDPPAGNTINCARIDSPDAPHILVTHLMEGIGLALDLPGGRMFATDLAGSIYSADLNGTNKRVLRAAQGNLSGIAYADL
jgi:hypothetical protein